jgi:hypothetical protein
MLKFTKLLFLTALFLTGAQLQSQTLLHYWNFNTTSSYSAHIAPSASIISGVALDTAKYGVGTSLIDYANGTGQGFDVNNVNARNGDPSGNHLRFNNPIYGALIFSLPTTGYKDIIVKYAGMRSGSGAYYQFIHYTTDGTNYQLLDTIEPTTTPTLYTLDFSAIANVKDNAKFKVRITFGQGGGGVAGNNRIDNFTVEGNSISGGDLIKPTVNVVPVNGTTLVSIGVASTFTFSEDVRLKSNTALDNQNVDSLFIFKLNNSTGADVAYDASITGRVITIKANASLLNKQAYYLALKKNVLEDLADNLLDTVYATTFTTLPTQTIFKAGDLVPVAYRMNATSTEDELGLLALVNILPGTMINLTDGKYTDNLQPQCAGGITWTAPVNGVAAGTVISIQTSAAIANVGTITGSGFGLSSGGDQIIIYTGDATAPSYITAISSNAWINANVSCSGSNSKLPAGLVDGKSSINLSTAKGNDAGNAVNAYYMGPQNLSYAVLKDSILDPKHWIAVAGATAPQTWPVWGFEGPPVIVSSKVLSNTSIQLVFNKDLDPVSAVSAANFTGIAGLVSVSRTNNGSKADTLVLAYNAAFSNSSSYTLTVNNIKDFQSVNMFSAYTYSFTYTTKISLDKTFAVIKEEAGNYALKLNITNPSAATVSLKVKPAPFSTAEAGTDFTLVDQVLTITGSTTEMIVNIPVINDNASEQDEYFVLELTNASGVAIDGKTFVTLYIKDNDKKVPVATKELELMYINSFNPDSLAGSTCEIVAYDSVSKRLFMTSAIEDRLDIASFANPSKITLVKSVDMSVYGGITSLAVKNGILAVASPNVNEQLNGKVVFFTTNGDYIKDVTVGALPDMVVFTPDGKYVMTANEGQPSVDYTVDPEGSVSIIDISAGVANLTQSNVSTLLFTALNAFESTYINSGVRKLKKSSTLSQDFEPEYISVSSDSKTAWVTLQENNAIAVINLDNKSITSVWPLGTKDWSAAGNGFDASDNNQNVLLSSWPVKSFYIPDGIANFRKNGVNYIVTANEGDEKEYNGLNERTTVGATDYKLDSAKFPHAAMLKESHNLGRLRVTNLNGDTDADGDFDQIYSVGARSFSIFNADSKSLVFDSQDDFEQITSKDTAYAKLFNADNESNAVKSRSRAKGPEPEGVCLANINSRTYAFVGLERVGGVMAYNITNPLTPAFVDYKNSRSATSFAGDHAPEGIIYISPKQSPDGKHYVVVANEISGTLSVFELKVNTQPVGVEEVAAAALVSVYPNPSNGQQVSFTAMVSGEMLDVMGQQVQTFTNTDKLDVSQLADGVYIIRMSNGQTLNLVVQK